MLNKSLLIGLLIVMITSFTSWFPFLATIYILDSIIYIVIVYALASLTSTLLSLAMYKNRRIIGLSNAVLAVMLITLYGLSISTNTILSWIILLSLITACTGYLGKSYSLIVRSSPKIPKPLKPKIIEKVTTRSWLYGFIGSTLFSLIASNTPLTILLGLLSAFMSILLIVPTILYRPLVLGNHGDENGQLYSFKAYIVLAIYVCVVVLALNIYSPFLPVFLERYLGLSIIGVGLFYASITVLSRVMFSIAQLIIAVKDSIVVFTIRSLLMGLLLITASSSENPWFTLILLTIAMSSSSLHTLAYSVFARRMGVKLTFTLELVYTAVGVLAVFLGYNLWNRMPSLILAIPALILIASTMLTGYLRRYRDILLLEK